jgi:hypothetical protein
MNQAIDGAALLQAVACAKAIDSANASASTAMSVDDDIAPRSPQPDRFCVPPSNVRARPRFHETRVALPMALYSWTPGQRG